MQPVLLYAIVVGGLLGSFFAYRASLGISDIVRSRLAALILKHLIYPFVFRRQRFLPPVTRLHILTQVLYWSGTVVCNFIGISDFPEASSRAGTLAIFHFIPLMLGSRLSFAADLLGLPYRTFIHLHSSVGLMAVVQSTLHVVLAFKSQNVNLQRMNTRFGLVAGSATLALLIHSLPVLRRLSYEVFLNTHYVLNILVFYSVWQHLGGSVTMNKILILTAIGLMLWINSIRMFSILYRNLAHRMPWTRAQMIRRNDALELLVHIPRPWKVKAGEFIYLVSFPWFAQSHPFSIAWWQEEEDGQCLIISLLIKPQNGFTKHLFHIAHRTHWLRVAIDGPYSQSLDITTYGTIVMFATGIGIATQIPLIKQALEDYRKCQTAIRRVSLIWQLDQESDQEWVADWMDKLLEEDRETLMLRSSLYVVQGFESDNNFYGQTVKYGKRVGKFYGKANLKDIMAKEMVDRQGKMLVTVSAEPVFRDSVRNLVRDVVEWDVRYHEMDFQPEGHRGIRGFKRTKIDHEGAI